MSDLMPYAYGGLARRDSRELGRELSRLNARGRLELARIDQATDLQIVRSEGVAAVAGAAMNAVARATVHGQQLAAAVPAAEGRIAAVLDALTVAQIGLVHDTARRLR